MRQASSATARHYHRQIHMAADEIVRNREHCPIVLINGPSSSGKTTTNDRIARIVELAGVHANMLSMDDYYRTAADYEQPMDDENRGTRSRQSPECMDLARLSDDLRGSSPGKRSRCRALTSKRAPLSRMTARSGSDGMRSS